MRRVCTRLTTVGAIAIAAATLVALPAGSWWIAELFSHFRIQYIVAALVLCAAALLVRHRTLAVVMLGTVAINAVTAQAFSSRGVAIEVPSSPGATDARDDPATVRILSANVRARNRDPSALVDVIRSESPDVVLVIEYTEAFAAALDAIRTEYRYGIHSSSYGHFSIALYSRLPLRDAAIVPLGETDTVIATIESPARDIPFIGTHLLPPTGAAWARARNAQLDRLTQLLDERAPETVVCGDFNLSPYSPYFARFVEASGLRHVSTGRPLRWTWPAGFMPFGVPIDHCFTGESVVVAGEEVLGDIGSDHYPLRIDISVGSNG